jgi:hypothetical protein
MDSQLKQFSIAKDFTIYPGPRYKIQGEDSGQKFFEDILDSLMRNAIQEKFTLEINLDGTAGYASSFLDEAFGNLVMKYGKENVIKHLVIISIMEPDWIDMIFNETIPEWEKKRQDAAI